MKKFILAAIVAVSAVAANAQTWAGGSFGINTVKVKGSDKTIANFEVAPEIGYSLNDNWDIAAKIGYAHIEDGAFDGIKMGMGNALEINPYVRYTFSKTGNFKFFVDGGFSYAMVHENGVDDNANLWKLGFNPGIAYGLTDKVSLVAHVGDVSYSYAKIGAGKINSFNVSLTNAISFGAYVSF